MDQKLEYRQQECPMLSYECEVWKMIGDDDDGAIYHEVIRNLHCAFGDVFFHLIHGAV